MADLVVRSAAVTREKGGNTIAPSHVYATQYQMLTDTILLSDAITEINSFYIL
jgi:hypothetical protein